MTIFIKYKSDGEILSVSKVNLITQGIERENPFEILDDNQFVLKVPLTDELRAIEAIKLHDDYQVDVTTQQLIEKQ